MQSETSLMASWILRCTFLYLVDLMTSWCSSSLLPSRSSCTDASACNPHAFTTQPPTFPCMHTFTHLHLTHTYPQPQPSCIDSCNNHILMRACSLSFTHASTWISYSIHSFIHPPLFTCTCSNLHAFVCTAAKCCLAGHSHIPPCSPCMRSYHLAPDAC